MNCVNCGMLGTASKSLYSDSSPNGQLCLVPVPSTVDRTRSKMNCKVLWPSDPNRSKNKSSKENEDPSCRGSIEHQGKEPRGTLSQLVGYLTAALATAKGLVCVCCVCFSTHFFYVCRSPCQPATNFVLSVPLWNHLAINCCEKKVRIYLEKSSHWRRKILSCMPWLVAIIDVRTCLSTQQGKQFRCP